MREEMVSPGRREPSRCDERVYRHGGDLLMWDKAKGKFCLHEGQHVIFIRDV